MTDFANAAAAVAAGYKEVDVDRGAGLDIDAPLSPRYLVRLEIPIVGEIGLAGGLFSAQGESDVSLAAAQTNATTALNAARGHRWGFGATVNKGPNGGAMTGDK